MCVCSMSVTDGELSAGFLSDLGVKLEDISFFEGENAFYCYLTKFHILIIRTEF